MYRRILAAATLSFLAGSAAIADDASITATLASPTIKQEQILGGTLWRCAETTCRSASRPTDTGLQACRGVAKRFGQITAFAYGDKALDADQLSNCNQSAKN